MSKTPYCDQHRETVAIVSDTYDPKAYVVPYRKAINLELDLKDALAMSKHCNTNTSLAQAIRRLETVEQRLRYIGWRWKWARREYEADIIVNEVLPVLRSMLEGER